MFKGKAIYNPSGKAGEYSYWACNFYVGCSNECTYCYLKKGRGAKILGGNKPTLKKCFKNEDHAIEVFKKELNNNIDELKKHGLFFSFSTDPCLPETINLTYEATRICQYNDVPVKILTKRTDFTNDMKYGFAYLPKRNLIAFGFTLTGHDEIEPNASQHHSRISAMKRSKELGFKTFASIEPIIKFESAKTMIEQTKDFCDLFKIGLESGGVHNKDEALEFVGWLYSLNNPKIYMKESLQKLTGISNRDNGYYFVERDYNLFKEELNIEL
jgi:DNA repair photolyase